MQCGRTWLTALQDVLFKADCPLCQRSTRATLCLPCQNKLRRYEDCHIEIPVDLTIWAWGTYGGDLKQALKVLKYDHQPQIAQLLGYWMGQAWLRQPLRSQPPRPAVVVPIPLHPSKLAQRGYNQAFLLAQSFCRTTRLPLLDILRRTRTTQAQYGLTATERQQNLHQAFQLKNRDPDLLRDRAILLLDDIYTTGATTQAAAAALRQSRLTVGGVIVLAHSVASTSRKRR